MSSTDSRAGRLKLFQQLSTALIQDEQIHRTLKTVQTLRLHAYIDERYTHLRIYIPLRN
jgi:ribosomal protein L17